MDLTKTKRRNNVIIISCILLLVAITVFSEKKDIIVFNTTWHVKNNACQVDFVIKNNTRERTWTNVTITAKKKDEKGAGPFAWQVVGEKSVAVVLKPHEAKKISQDFLVTATPEQVKVRLWKN